MSKPTFSRLLRQLFKHSSHDRRSSEEFDFNVETLEDRKMLAGNVTAAMKNGDLVIKGDKLSNNIDIIPIQTGVRVIGLPDPNGAFTTVNGLPSQSPTAQKAFCTIS